MIISDQRLSFSAPAKPHIASVCHAVWEKLVENDTPLNTSRPCGHPEFMLL